MYMTGYDLVTASLSAGAARFAGSTETKGEGMADLDESLELLQAMRRRDDKFVSELSLEEKYDLARRGWAVDLRRAQDAEALVAEWESRYDDMVEAYRQAMAKVEKLEANERRQANARTSKRQLRP